MTDLTLIGPLFTGTTKIIQAKSGQGKLSAKGNLQKRRGLKAPLFGFCFGTVRLFSKILNNVSRLSPLDEKIVIYFQKAVYLQSCNIFLLKVGERYHYVLQIQYS